MGRKPLVWLVLAYGLSGAAVASGQQPRHVAGQPLAVNSAGAPVSADQLQPASDSASRAVLTRKVSLSLDHVSLPAALKAIAAAGGVSVAFSPDILPAKQAVSLELEDGELGEALNEVLQGQYLKVRVSRSGMLVIIPGDGPLRANSLSEPLSAAAGRITGRVVDATTQQPISGASVVIVGTGRGSLTGESGAFVLPDVPAGAYQLRVSIIGYASQEQSVTVADGESATVNFALTPEAVALQSLVVVGYGTQQRRDLTGAISSVQSTKLQSLPVATVSSALEGQSAGLTVVSSGVPGADATFRIRGVSTIGHNDPLVVINGVPTMSGLNEVNPADIASIDVLKDASATAIYGSRGANGVVIITTKTGSANGPSLRFGTYAGFQQVDHMVHMLDASQFASLHNDMMQNAGRALDPDFAHPDQLGVGTDWLGALVETAPVQSYSAAYSGASDRTSFYVSGNALRQDGVIIHTGYKRYTFQLNTDTHLHPWLSFGENLTLNHDENRSGSYNIQSAMAAQPEQPIFNADGTYSGPIGRSEWVGDITNPIGQATLIHNSTTGYNLIGSLYGDLKFTDDLELRSDFGLQANLWDSRTWSPQYDWQPSPQELSYLGEEYHRSTTWVEENTLTYSRQLGRVHDLKVMLGTSAQANRQASMNGSVQGFASDRTQELSNGIQQPTLGGDESDWGILSFMGRVNYSYKDTYLLTATLRRDGSSRFGQGKKWGLFPSVAGAWRLSNEPFLKGSNFVHDLKLRFGYGSTGNQEIGNYAFASSLQPITYTLNGTLVNGVVPNVMPNPNVHWESVNQYNVGLDGSVLHDRVHFSFDGYVKNTTGMLVPMSVPVTTGYSDIVTPYINAGKMRNRGIEAAISTDNLHGRLKWTSNFDVAYNQNEVVSLNDTIPMPVGSIDFNYSVARIQAGHPVNAFYGYVVNGIFQTQQDVDRYAVQVPGADPYNRTSPGDIRFLDLNNDGVINDQDRTFLGDPNPDFTFSVDNTLSYGPLDLRVFLQGVAGNQIFNANRIWSEGMASARNQTTATLGRWTGPGTSNVMPRAVYGDPNGNARASSRFIEDGSYLRVKQLTVGYTLPDRFAGGLRTSSARVYVAAQNLWTLTGYTGFDPEVGADGIDNNVYPLARTVSVGVDLAF